MSEMHSSRYDHAETVVFSSIIHPCLNIDGLCPKAKADEVIDNNGPELYASGLRHRVEVGRDAPDDTDMRRSTPLVRFLEHSGGLNSCYVSIVEASIYWLSSEHHRVILGAGMTTCTVVVSITRVLYVFQSTDSRETSFCSEVDEVEASVREELDAEMSVFHCSELSSVYLCGNWSIR
tara:strand:- start:397 stop:930 length:534 start_codon:yes stop_codon:yes gene_type:complete